MPPNAGPHDIPSMMESENISVDSDEDDFVMLEMDDGESAAEDDENAMQGMGGLSGYMPLMDSEDQNANTATWGHGTHFGSSDETSDSSDPVNDAQFHLSETTERTTRAEITVPTQDLHGKDTRDVSEVRDESQNLASDDSDQATSEMRSPPSPQPNPQSMSTEHANLVKQAMASFTLPSANIPDWAKEIPEEKWKESLFSSITKRGGQTS